MCHFLLTFFRLSNNLFYGQLCELLAMAIQLTVTFSSLLVEHQYFLAFHQRRNHFANHLCAFYRGKTYCHVAIVVDQQHFLKFNSLVSLSVLHVLHEQFLAFHHLELLTVNFYNCVHFYGLNGFFHKADALVASLV